MDAESLGRNALVGWRAKVADVVADPLARRTPLSAGQARALVGAAFFALSVYYVVGTLRRIANESQG